MSPRRLRIHRGASPDVPDEPREASMWSRLSLLIGDRRRLVVLLVLASILSGMTEALTLALIAEIAAGLVTTSGRSGEHQTHVGLGLLHIHAPVGTLIGLAAGLATLRLLLQVPISTLPARIAADVQARMRTNLFHSFTRASWDVQSRDREGQMQETMTSQAMQATLGALNMTGLLTSAFTFLVLLASAFALNLVAAAVAITVALAMFALLRPLRGVGVRRSRALSQSQIRYAAGIAESVRVAEETQVFGAGAAQRSQVDGFIGAAQQLFFETQMLIKLGSNISQSMIYLLIVAGLGGLYLVGGSHAGSLGAIVLILVRASSSAQSVQSAYQGLIQAMPFIERTQEAERRYRESMPHVGGRELRSVSSLAFEHVDYGYRTEQPVLKDINFDVAGGEVIGIIGPSGAGKSTLVQLLLRLRAPDAGRYLVNGVTADEFTEADWHRMVAYVPQEPRLLHASVAENIRYFRDLDDEAVERAGRLARIHDDVMGWRDGYQTIVGPRADAVSGGQQQRICLARALVAQPEVLVLDEPTSALDPHSETLIQESLTGLKQELTLFIVAHRMSTLDICDRVMVVIDGRLAAFDTIEQLQRHNDYYRSASTIATGGAPSPEEHPREETEVPVDPAELDPAVALGLEAAPGDGGPPVRAVPAGSATPARTNGAPYAAGGRRVPDFFLVGHPKCGTTALYEALRRHPQIYMPAGKEPWFFAPELHVRTPPRPEGTPRTLEQYLALFADARPDQRVGEATALYLWSHTAASRIAEVQPEARIIAILREPASFLRSLHLQFLQTYVETEPDLGRALALEPERREGRQMPGDTYWPQALLYSEHVRYVEQLRRYREVFAPEQMLVLVYDDFRSDNEATVRRVLRFLDVDDSAPVTVTEANPTVRARSQRLHEAVHALSVGRGPVSSAVKATVKAVTPQRLRREALHATQRHVVFVEPEPPDERLMSELRRRYKSEVVALSEYLGRDLVSLWGYDGVG